jgi:hypothetical protein
MSYNLSNIPGFINCMKNGEVDSTYDKYYNLYTYFTKSNEQYDIIRYNKEFMSCDLYSTYGLLRSVIVSNNHIVSYSPPKSIDPESFILKYPFNNDNIIAEDFIEGTMINVFYDHSVKSWQIATRNTIGGHVSFYKVSENKVTEKTFNIMFMEACYYNKFNINILNQDYCYSFVLQHPCNRIVIPFKHPQLFLVEVYQIKEDINDGLYTIIPQDMNLVKQYGLWSYTTIQFPEKYMFNSYSELIDKFASANTPYDTMGIIIKNTVTGERTKFRNPIYEEVKSLRGNQPKLQYQYLCLRKSGKIPEFLKYYPEFKKDLSAYRDGVHMFTNTLHKNYIYCYVKKEKPLNQFPDQYRTHMFKLHEHYLNVLRSSGLFVTNTVVIKYVNDLHPSLLMYCLNHNYRKRMIDIIKVDSKMVI